MQRKVFADELQSKVIIDKCRDVHTKKQSKVYIENTKSGVHRKIQRKVYIENTNPGV